MKTDTYVAELSRDMLFTLAERAAREIHALIVTMQLRRIGCAQHPTWTDGQRETVASLRRFLRTLRHAEQTSPAWPPHREFRGFVKLHLDKIFAEKGTARRWQDYVARVAAFNGAPCPAPGAPDWATFVLRERRAA